MTPADLLAFEDEMAALFNAGRIKAPLHLAAGNERQLIEIFRDIGAADWVLCGWRAHYHCLLKGVPAHQLRAKILDGRSIALCFAEHKILSSAIVGGILPIAVGLAWGIKRRGGNGRVWAFIGDMTAECGVVDESHRYARGHDLPLEIVVEDNGVSVCTPTAEVWGARKPLSTTRYTYDLERPHVGTGTFVRF